MILAPFVAAASLNTLPITGSKASLTTLAAAAQRCGFRDAKVGERIGRFPVVVLNTRGFGDHRTECVIKWIFAHPEQKLGFIGNEAAH